MKTFKEYVETPIIVENFDDGELMEVIAEKFRNHFPNGWIRRNTLSSVVVGMGKDTTMRIRAGLIGDGAMLPNKNDISNGIIENDLMKMYFTIDYSGDDVVMQSQNKSTLLTINPTKKYMALGYNKIPFRKATIKGGDAKKIITTLERHFKRVAEEVKKEANNNNFYNQLKYNPKYFMVK